MEIEEDAMGGNSRGYSNKYNVNGNPASGGNMVMGEEGKQGGSITAAR